MTESPIMDLATEAFALLVSAWLMISVMVDRRPQFEFIGMDKFESHMPTEIVLIIIACKHERTLIFNLQVVLSA